MLSRKPDDEERKLLGKLFVSRDRSEHDSWKAVARALLNLSETTTRN